MAKDSRPCTKNPSWELSHLAQEDLGFSGHHAQILSLWYNRLKRSLRRFKPVMYLVKIFNWLSLSISRNSPGSFPALTPSFEQSLHLARVVANQTIPGVEPRSFILLLENGEVPSHHPSSVPTYTGTLYFLCALELGPGRRRNILLAAEEDQLDWGTPHQSFCASWRRGIFDCPHKLPHPSLFCCVNPCSLAKARVMETGREVPAQSDGLWTLEQAGFKVLHSPQSWSLPRGASPFPRHPGHPSGAKVFEQAFRASQKRLKWCQGQRPIFPPPTAGFWEFVNP